MSIIATLFPPENRKAAAVAFLRTFWQVVRATSWLGSGGLVTVSALQLASIDLQTLLFAAGAVLVSAVGSGLIAAGNILANGLPAAYQDAAVASISTATLSTIVVSPADPDQPAAGVPPAVDDAPKHAAL